MPDNSVPSDGSLLGLQTAAFSLSSHGRGVGDREVGRERERECSGISS